MTIRTATLADLPVLLDLAVAFYAEDGFTTGPAELEHNLRALVAADDARAAVAEVDGAVVGFALTTRTFGLESGWCAELQDLFVAPAARGGGIGAALVEDSVGWARACGCSVVDVVIAPNGQDVTHLFGFYAARGFRDDGRRMMHRDLG